MTHIKLSEAEAERIFKDHPTGQEQYDAPIGPTRPSPPTPTKTVAQASAVPLTDKIKQKVHAFTSNPTVRKTGHWLKERSIAIAQNMEKDSKSTSRPRGGSRPAPRQQYGGTIPNMNPFGVGRPGGSGGGGGDPWAAMGNPWGPPPPPPQKPKRRKRRKKKQPPREPDFYDFFRHPF